jgi:hypothetical protein
MPRELATVEIRIAVGQHAASLLLAVLLLVAGG